MYSGVTTSKYKTPDLLLVLLNLHRQLCLRFLNLAVGFNNLLFLIPFLFLHLPPHFLGLELFDSGETSRYLNVR